MSTETGDGERIHPLSKRLTFIERDGFGRAIELALFIMSGLLVAVDALTERHAVFGFEGFPGFHTVFGFLAFCFVVITGWPLRAILSRPESYYGEGDEDA